MKAVVKEEQKTQLATDSEALQQLAKELGYSNKVAKELKIKKLTLFKTTEAYEEQLSLRDKIKLARQIPIDIFGGIAKYNAFSKEEKARRLWDIGIDTDFPCITDIGCTSVGANRLCGYLVIGQERTDKEWISMRVNGKHVASWEAQMAYKNDPSLTHELSKLKRGT